MSNPSVPDSSSACNYRGRFAPSPTGPLHFGSLLAALGSWLRARQAGGEWLLRIEDLDTDRKVPGADQQQLETLARFGLIPDQPPQWQSQRIEHYAATLDRLIEIGVAYPCTCSRSDLSATAGLHPLRCASSQPDRNPAWRVRVPDTAMHFDDAIQGPQQFNLRGSDDFVLKRTEGYFAYPLAVVVDDAEQGISEVVRGADLLEETPRQIWLQDVLGLPHPAYAHLPLLLDRDGRKLGKSQAAKALDADDPLPALRAALALLGVHSRARDVDSSLREAVDTVQWPALYAVRSLPGPIDPD